MALGAFAIVPGLASNGSAGSGRQAVGLAAADAGNAGMAPLVERQSGAMLDPRRESRKVRRAKQAAAQLTAAEGAAAAPAVPNPNCTLIVPDEPLTARGLATPYQLVATDPAAGPCHEADVNQTAFVQGAIISGDGKITLYDPLVVDKGTQPLVKPAPVQVPRGATVAVWFGFNGTDLTLARGPRSDSLRDGRCVNGVRGSIFTQFAYCNAPEFFRSATGAIRAGRLTVPALGVAADGLACPTVRDFSVVDQDQSDNVTSHELTAGNGRTGQNNAATRAAITALGQTGTDLANGSDNRLLTAFVDPALGCTPWTAPNASADNAPTPSLPLDELQAAVDQKAPIANVPLTDPMALVGDATASQLKTDLYRVGVDQPPVGRTDNGSGTTYCANLFATPAGIQRVFRDMATLATGPSPDPAAATNLFTFLAMRAQQTYVNLGCQPLLNMNNPITLTLGGNNVVTAATYTPGGAPTVTTSPGASPTITSTITPTTTPTITPTITPTTIPTSTPTTIPTTTPTTIPTTTPTTAPTVTVTVTVTVTAAT
jgi:hypothetical protein